MRYVNTYEQRWYRDDSPFAQICAEGFFILTTEKGTKYEKYIKGLTNFYEILFKSFEPFFFNGSFSDVAVSRKFSSYETGHRILNSMLLAGLSAPKEYQEKIWKTVKREIEKNKFYKYFYKVFILNNILLYEK